MEHMLFIIQYTIKKSIISVFDDLRHRRPIVQTDSPAASQESFHSISIVSNSKAPPSGRGVCQLSDDNGFEYHLKTFCGQSMTPEYSECVHWLHATACVTSGTCSLTDKWFVTVTPSIFIDVTRWMSVSGGGRQTTPSSTFREYDFQRLATIYLQIISRRPLLSMFKLNLARTYVAGWNQNVRVVCIAYLYSWLPGVTDVRSAAFTTLAYAAGPTADPWVILVLMLSRADISSLYLTQWLRSWKKSTSQL